MTGPSGKAVPVARLTGTYSLSGLTVEVSATDEVAALIDSRLRFLRAPAAMPAPVTFDIRAGDDSGFATLPGGAGRPVYNAPPSQLLYFGEHGQLFIDYPGCFRMLCDPSAGLVQSAVLGDGPGSVLAAYPFFTIPLIEVMKHRGRFSLHAGCVAREGNGVLLAGTSGSGKSTLTAALVRDGWDYVTDDMVFLTGQAGKLSAWGVSDTIDCSDRTAAMFPELRHLAGAPTLGGRGKHPVDVEETFGVLPLPVCRPRALVLPTITGERESTLRPVSAPYALRELVPNVLLTDGAAAQAHLDMLADLVRAVPCYSMATGTDLTSAVRRVAEVLG